MLIRRILLVATILFAFLVAGTAFLFSGNYWASAVNLLLPNGWTLQTEKGIDLSFQQGNVEHFVLAYQGCPLFTADNLQIKWWDARELRLSKGQIDYACLARLPKSEATEPPSIKLPALLALLPEGEARIDALHWVNLPDSFPTRIADLLATPSQSHFAFFQQKLTASLSHHFLTANAELEKNHLLLQADYQPSDLEKHRLTLNADLVEIKSFLPQQLTADYHWQLPAELIDDPLLQTGKASLAWGREQTNLVGKLQVDLEKQSRIHFPFRLEQNSLSIQQGLVESAFWQDFPLKAYVSATVSPASGNFSQLFPLQTSLRVSLLSQSPKGKGNLVISTANGLIERQGMDLPLQMTGEVKAGESILYSTVPMDIRGNWPDLSLKFKQGALLRMVGKYRFLTIRDLRFPLAGISVDKFGIRGRLQAIFRGESPDFKDIELHLDGYAKHFKAGALALFDTPNVPKAEQDQWNWRFWGKSRLPSLKTELALSGRGHWKQDKVQLSEFKGSLAQIRQQSVVIPSLSLALRKPINFAYNTFYLDGAVELSAPKITFAYGGELLKPKAEIAFQGETENLRLNGQISAGELGPIRLFARRQLTDKSSVLLGKLYWKAQPAQVFQSLFPFRNQWVITGGSIKGETAFSVNIERGLIAGGHLVIQQGGLSLPSGEVKGIHFSLPYRFQQNGFVLGTKAPVEVNIDELNLGIPMKNVSLKLQGHYPYDRRRSLNLRELRLELLGGSLNVDYFALPQTRLAELNLRGIRLEELLDLAQYNQIQLSGRANARLPFWLNGKPCYICDGVIEQAENSYLKFTPELMRAIQQAGYTERILSHTVHDSEIERFQATLNVDSKGQMQLAAKIRSHLREQPQTKLNLNYNHTENLFDLWHSINYGSTFEQQIEHRLYQRLDGK